MIDLFNSDIEECFPDEARDNVKKKIENAKYEEWVKQGLFK